MKSIVITIPIAQISNRFDVRRALNEDRIVQLAEFYQNENEPNAIQLPPIEVVALPEGGYAFVDGRHRAAALALLNRTEIRAIVLPDADRLTLYAKALQANWGGALPPSQDDIRHVILRMVEAGAKQKNITDKLQINGHPMFPISAIRRYMSDANTLLKRRKLHEALDLVANGGDIPSVAKQLKLDEEFIRDAIAGRKRKWGTNEAKNVLAENKNYVLTTLRSANNGISQKIQTLLFKVEHGEIPPDIAAKVIEAWSSRVHAMAHRIKDWEERLASATEKGVLPEGELDSGEV